MINLVAIEPKENKQLLLRFSDGASGIYDFSHFTDANTTMTAPLNDRDFFARCFIEAGALAWPNGFDLSAGALHRASGEAGQLRRDAEAA